MSPHVSFSDAFENKYFSVFGKLVTARQRVNILMRIVHGLYNEILEVFESYEGPVD